MIIVNIPQASNAAASRDPNELLRATELTVDLEPASKIVSHQQPL